MVDVFNASTARSFNSEVVFKEHVVSGAYATAFALGLITKDVGIAANLAEESGVDAPLTGSPALAGTPPGELGHGADHSEAHKAGGRPTSSITPTTTTDGLMGRLDGKVALISGAARGQGEAEARLFAREGASVVLGDVRGELGEQVAREIAAAGGTAVFEPLDVRREGDWERAVALAEREFGGLDILVNNAGILGRPGILETSLELWHEVVAVNQTGPFLGMRAAIPAMRRRGGGSIVNISSALAEVGYGESASYTAAKGALSALTRTVAVELATEGIRVNVVHPGVIDTPMTHDGGGVPRRSPPRRDRADRPHGPLRRDGRGGALPGERRGVVRDGRRARRRRRPQRLVTRRFRRSRMRSPSATPFQEAKRTSSHQGGSGGPLVSVCLSSM